MLQAGDAGHCVGIGGPPSRWSVQCYSLLKEGRGPPGRGPHPAACIIITTPINMIISIIVVPISSCILMIAMVMEVWEVFVSLLLFRGATGLDGFPDFQALHFLRRFDGGLLPLL